MITLLIADKEKNVRDVVGDLLCKEGNIRLYVSKQGNIIRIAKDDEIKDMVTLEDKIRDMEESLWREKSGSLYKSIIEMVEKSLFECILERFDGNQLKAAKILGINRNTMRAKVKKLGIDSRRWKV
jgi:DNA-binding protein Fis